MKISILMFLILGVALDWGFAESACSQVRIPAKPLTPAGEKSPLKPDYVITDTMFPKITSNPLNMWASVGGFMDYPNKNKNLGAQVMFGMEFHPIGVDFKAMFGSANFGGVSNALGPNDLPSGVVAADYPSGNEPGSELNRPRLHDDPWSYFFLQPGISIENKIVQNAWPMFSNRMRLGAGYGWMTDAKNSIKFTAWLLSADAYLGYRLGAGSRWVVELGASWNYGAANSDQFEGNMGRIPISWFVMSLGLKYWF